MRLEVLGASWEVLQQSGGWFRDTPASPYCHNITERGKSPLCYFFISSIHLLDLWLLLYYKIFNPPVQIKRFFSNQWSITCFQLFEFLLLKIIPRSYPLVIDYQILIFHNSFFPAVQKGLSHKSIWWSAGKSITIRDTYLFKFAFISPLVQIFIQPLSGFGSFVKTKTCMTENSQINMRAAPSIVGRMLLFRLEELGLNCF